VLSKFLDGFVEMTGDFLLQLAIRGDAPSQAP
jgi:hypothetical protein